MTVYLRHFGRNFRHARHYLGFCKDLTTRLEQHISGRGRGVKISGVIWRRDRAGNLAHTLSKLDRGGG